MKKLFVFVFVFGILAALAISACQVKEEGELAPEGKVFTAIMEAFVDEAAGVDTKTSLDAGGSVLWKMGDQVSIFAGSTINEQYQVTDASDGRTAAALNRVESPGFVAGGDIDNNVAFYPYAETAELAKNGSAYVIRDIALPATQTYAQASFGNGAFPMVAVTSSTRDYNLKFKNVLGGLKLQLKGTATIASVSVTGNNNEILFGAAEVIVSNTTAPSISLTDATAKTVTLDCGDGVQLNENTATVFIIALPPMTMSEGFTVTVTDSQNKQMEIKTTRSQTITRSDLLSMPVVTYEGTGSDPVSDPVAVDLGLTSGLKWASCNVGATAPEDYGDYFAWGETEPYYTAGHSQDDPCSNWKANKTGYYWIECPFRTSGDSYSNVQFSKYNTLSSYGPIDNNTILAPEDDAAHVNWGGSWRMPTYAEWIELYEVCTWTWTTQKGVNGRLVTGPNGNSIFLPAAGERGGTRLFSVGSRGRYWSSSLDTDAPYRAYIVHFLVNVLARYGSERCDGFSVRPVSDEGVRVSVTSVSLDKSSLELAVEETATITATIAPSNATQNDVIWSSSDTSIATVSWQGVVTAVAAGAATITAKTYDGSYTAICSVTVGPASTPTAVDLGLTSGIQWATFNIGATAPEEYGDYFAWGEVLPYYTKGHSKDNPCSSWRSRTNPLITGYNWESYKWCNGSASTLTKYNYSSSYGTIDNKTVLDPEDDAARINWGGSWRLPRTEEWTELRKECTWTWTTQNGVNGRLVIGPNGNSIFLPAAGYRYNTGLFYSRSAGCYWSSSHYSTLQDYAFNMYFDSDDVSDYSSCDLRCRGQSVRPVTDEGVRVSVTSISLNKQNISLCVNQSYQELVATTSPSNATQKAVIWSSSNSDVATVSWLGVVTAAGAGKATITATTYDGGLTATCVVTVYDNYVDLGLPSGIKWATCNVGADVPYEYGDYFAWGATSPYYTAGHSQDNPCSNWKTNRTGYDWSSCRFRTSGDSYSNVRFSKYNTLSSHGTVDNRTALELEDDAAHVNRGGSWRMPTKDEFNELRNNCTSRWTTQNGVKGMLFTSKTNGKSIFLPAAGNRKGTDLSGTSSGGYYWSSSLYTNTAYEAYQMSFDSNGVYMYDLNRCYGLAVRPVTE